MTDLQEQITELLDREAIRQCLMRYSRAIDRVDEPLLRTVYWPDAVDNHGSCNGPVEGFIAWVIPLLHQMQQTMHFLGNILIEIVDDVSYSETYFIALHRFADEAGRTVETHVAGRYLDRMEKRSGEWRIRHRDVVYDGFSEVDRPGDWEKPAFGLAYQPNRYPDDISYEVFAGRLRPS